ncbi:hypothetical protein [Phenylobacterium sp. CCH9-H3]|uniref:hypothetical protein n=1 Tax=Phenylobacterium sp. CCH9-H3 TaxID=1768774 RepID=UPI00083B02D9|nr:hypothetical protein [Phenylobacterium sp. CCH9-H3]
MLAIVGVVGLVLWTTWRAPSRPAPAGPVAAAPDTPPPVAAVLPPVKTTPPPLSRTDLILEAQARAAGALASGEASTTGRDPLVDRRFSVRIPFGCEGPRIGGGSSQAYYEVDAERRTLKLVARPVDLAHHPLVAQSPDAKAIEALETFWIPRPWTRTDTCPPRRDRPASATPTPPSPQTLGLATISEVGASRLRRRAERPYELVRKAPDDEPLPLSASYSLVLEGRLATFPTGGAVRCWSESPEHRPICIYAVALDRVAFETPDGQLLAEWRD